jgi:hypothetical protein
MSGVSDEPLESIQHALTYGQITFDISHLGLVPPSEEVLQQMIAFARTKIQNEVVPAVEHIVEEDEVHVGRARHPERERELHLLRTTLSAHADCELAVDVSDSALDRVEQVVEEKLLVPLQNKFELQSEELDRQTRRNKDAARRRFVQAVRSVFGDFDGRGA